MGMRCWKNNEAVWRLLKLLFLGQVVSFLIALSAFCSSLVASLVYVRNLQSGLDGLLFWMRTTAESDLLLYPSENYLLLERGVNTPLSLSFSCYLALALVYGSIVLYRRQKLLIPWYWYLALGFVDVQGNYLVNKAYQFSSITSVTLLDCCTIAWVIGLTWYYIGTRYSLCQLLGAAICVIGLGLVLLSDAGASGGGGSKPLLGDVLVIAGTIFYAMSNVGEEFCVKKTFRVEVVSMLGLFGTLISLCEIAFVERKSLESVDWSADIILAFAGNAFAGFLFYSLTPFVLKMGGSTLFNLSILTCDMWAVVIRIFIYHQQVDWLYFVSFAVVSVGLIIYSKIDKDQAPNETLEDENLAALYQELSQESEESRNGTEIS